MPISTRVVANALVAARITLFDLTAQGRGPAHFDGGHDAPLCNGHRRAMLLSISFSVAAKYIRHFELRAIHGPAAQKYWGAAGAGSTGTGRGSRSKGLEVEHTLLVAIRR